MSIKQIKKRKVKKLIDGLLLSIQITINAFVVGVTYNYLFNDTESKFEHKIPIEVRRQIEKINEGRRINKYNNKEIMQEKKILLDINEDMKIAQKALEDGNTKLCLNAVINAKGDIQKLKIMDKREYFAKVFEIEKELKILLKSTESKLEENFEDMNDEM